MSKLCFLLTITLYFPQMQQLERGIHCTSQCPPSNVCCRSHTTHSVSPLSSVQVPSPGQDKQWGPCPSVELNVYTAYTMAIMSQCSEAVWLFHVPCYQVLHQHSVSHVRPDILTTHTASKSHIWGGFCSRQGLLGLIVKHR